MWFVAPRSLHRIASGLGAYPRRHKRPQRCRTYRSLGCPGVDRSVLAFRWRSAVGSRKARSPKARLSLRCRSDAASLWSPRLNVATIRRRSSRPLKRRCDCMAAARANKTKASFDAKSLATQARLYGEMWDAIAGSHWTRSSLTKRRSAARVRSSHRQTRRRKAHGDGRDAARNGCNHTQSPVAVR